VPLLELIDVTKRFSSLKALDGVSFDLRAGEVHAVVGENGAGKSTLINILSGIFAPDSGRVRLEGADLTLADAVTARRRGIVTVHQEVELFAPLSLAENLALAFGLPTKARGFVDWRRIELDAAAAVASLRETIDVQQAAGQLRIAERQMARIAAAVRHRAKVLLLDEPTSSLSASETRWLFDHIRQLRAAGVGIIYISHRTTEIFDLADRITVLRDGRRVWSGSNGDISPDQLIKAMVGRQYVPACRAAPSEARAPRPVRLEVVGLEDKAGRFAAIDLQARAGEIVALYGLVGAGRSEFAQAVLGLRPASGSVAVDGQPLAPGNPGRAAAAGIGYVPEDRLRQALFHDLSVRTNTSICNLKELAIGPFTAPRRERAAVAKLLQELDMRCASIEQPARELSGGNQQKAVLARWLLTHPKVFILDEPTRGVDVAAKSEIHRWMREYASRGNAVVMISSDLHEVSECADRVVVFREGRVSGEFAIGQTSAEQIAAAALPGNFGSNTDRSPIRPGRRLPRPPAAEAGLSAAVLVLAVVLTLTTKGFLSQANLAALLTNTAVWAVLALAAAVVIIAGGIDISIGAIVALAAASAGLVLKSPLPEPAAVALGIPTALAVGALAGAANAVVALVGRIHAIVVTLATMTAYRGLLITLTGGEALTDLPASFTRLATDRIVGLNGSILAMIAIVLGMHAWLSYSVPGRHAYALGASATAARLVGISKRRVWLSVFSLGGTLAGAAGLMELAQCGSMQSSLGTGYELRAIAAAVIGGTAISGGRGTALGVFSGALLISLVHNALVLWQVSRYHSDLVIGALILAAVLWDLFWQRLESR
jgi:ABC-type sugar transport system ATPase subunit/ribose/xylose/arabinose/galactoside ABC-type transport system permease subunit